MVTFIQLREPNIYSPVDILNTFFAMGEGVRKMQDYFKQQQDELTMQEIFRQIGEKLTKLPSLSEFITPQHREQVQNLLQSGASKEEVDAFIRQQTGGQLSLADFIEEERKRVKQEISKREQITPTPERVERETAKRILSELLLPKKETMQSKVGATPEEAREDVEKAYRLFTEGGRKGLEIDIPEITAKQQVLDTAHQNLLQKEILKQSLGLPNVIDTLNLKNPYPEVIADILSIIYKTPMTSQGRAILFEQLEPALNILSSFANIRDKQIAQVYQKQLLDAKTQSEILLNLLRLQQERELKEEALGLEREKLEFAKEKEEFAKQYRQQQLELQRQRVANLLKTPIRDIKDLTDVISRLRQEIDLAQAQQHYDLVEELNQHLQRLLDMQNQLTQGRIAPLNIYKPTEQTQMAPREQWRTMIREALQEMKKKKVKR